MRRRAFAGEWGPRESETVRVDKEEHAGTAVDGPPVRRLASGDRARTVRTPDDPESESYGPLMDEPDYENFV